MKHTDIVVAGAGVLAREVCLALARLEGLRVTVLARTLSAADELAYLASSTSRAAGGSSSFHPRQVDFTSADSIGETVAASGPEIVLGCVSYHSPWEAQHQRTAWTELISTAGFGITLPLQWAFAARMARAVKDHAPKALFINGCFPDAVNPALRAAGLPVFCGIGNISSLAGALLHELRAGESDRLQLLAHHYHLSAPADEADDAIGWLNDKRLRDMPTLLRSARSMPRKQLCVLAGASAGRLVREILSGQEYYTSVPGPEGLPGGYPVRIESKRLRLDLPIDLTAQKAIEWNQRAARRDGVVVSSSGDIEFSTQAANCLAAYSRDLPARFRVEQLDQICEVMLLMRERLRHELP